MQEKPLEKQLAGDFWIVLVTGVGLLFVRLLDDIVGFLILQLMQCIIIISCVLIYQV